MLLKKEVFKVQLSLRPNKGHRDLLVYNKKLSAVWQGPADKDVVAMVKRYPYNPDDMTKGLKAYFWAYIDKDTGKVVLSRYAEWQEW
jgi:hypothetical protein